MSTTGPIGIDLDAAIRESAYPDGIPVPYKGHTFTMPAECPIDVFDPLLSADFNLVGVLGAILDDTDGKDMGESVMSVLFERPSLPAEARDTIYECLCLLFGAEQWAEFQALRPGLTTYAALIRGLLNVYGVSLGEAFASGDSSKNSGPTPNPTSPVSTPGSTPASSSAAPKRKKASSVSAGPATS